jgi:mono/diheme cytochrome c family protein
VNAPANAPGAVPDRGAAGGGPVDSVLDGVFTDAQAERGRDVFRAVCAECHESREFRGERFLLSWDGSSVGRFTDRLVSTMPDGAPGSLPPGDYLDVTAYILRLNGFPAGPRELENHPARLDAIRIERGGAEGGRP